MTEYKVDRPLSFWLFLPLALAPTVPFVFTLILVARLQIENRAVLIPIACGFVVGVLFPIWLSSIVVRYVELSPDAFLYPIPSRFGAMRRRMANEHVSLRKGRRFVRIRFKGGVPYFFPRRYTVFIGGRRLERELDVVNGRLEMT